MGSVVSVFKSGVEKVLNGVPHITYCVNARIDWLCSYFVSGFEGVVVDLVQHGVPHLDFIQLKRGAS